MKSRFLTSILHQLLLPKSYNPTCYCTKNKIKVCLPQKEKIINNNDNNNKMFPPVTCDYSCSLNNKGKEKGKPVELIITEPNHLLPDLLVPSSMLLHSRDYPDLERLYQPLHNFIFTALCKTPHCIYQALKAYFFQERNKRKKLWAPALKLFRS